MFFGSKATLGLDIGSSNVKAVQVRRNGRTIELAKFGMSEIYPDGEKPQDAGQIRERRISACKSALEQAGITARNTISSVSGESIIVRYIQLPENAGGGTEERAAVGSRGIYPVSNRRT